MSEPMQFDLLGRTHSLEEEQLSETRKRTLRAQRAIANGRHPLGGFLLEGSSETCGTCVYSFARQGGRDHYYKCRARKVTSGAATDLVLSWPACSMWKKPDQPKPEPPAAVFVSKMAPRTAQDAADAAKSTAAHQRRRVEEAIRVSRDGLTCDEVEVILSLPHQSASARVHDLMKLGRIRDSGFRRTTRAKRAAIVWECVAENNC